MVWKPLISRRKHMSLNDLAAKVGGGDCGDYEKQCLFLCIEGLVYNVCSHSRGAYSSDYHDVSQKCFVKILSSLSGFKKDKSCFSTWCWTVCLSVINSDKLSNKRKFDVLPIDCIDNMPTKGEMSSSVDVKIAVSEMFKEFSEYAAILNAIFGDPVENEYFVPVNIKLCEISDSLGIPVADVSWFLQHKLRPFMLKRYSELKKGKIVWKS